MLDDKGLTEADWELHAELTDTLELNAREKGSLTTYLCDWHKGYNKIVNDGQKQFNLMRRLQEANENGMCQCCCLGTWHKYTALDAGHFISKTKQATRFEPFNVHPQSKFSNNHKLGDDDKIFYTMFMMERFGREKTVEIMERAKEKFSWKNHQRLILTNRIVWAREIKKEDKRIDAGEPPENAISHLRHQTIDF